MITKAFIFTVGVDNNYSNCFEMEVIVAKGDEEWRTLIREFYEKMTGRPCKVSWDYEYYGKPN